MNRKGHLTKHQKLDTKMRSSLSMVPIPSTKHVNIPGIGIGIGMIPIPIPGISTCYVPGISTISRLDLIPVSSFLVFRKMSFTIHLNFSPLAGIIIQVIYSS